MFSSDSSWWFSVFRKTLLYFSLWPLLLVLPLDAIERVFLPLLYTILSRHLCALMAPHLLFSRLESATSLSLSPERKAALERCCSPLVIFMACLSLHSLQNAYFSLYWEAQHWAQYCEVASPVLSRGTGEAHSTCWLNLPSAAQDNICLLCCKGTLLVRVQLGVHQHPQVLFCTVAFQLHIIDTSAYESC